MQDEYIEGFKDALGSVPIVSAEYAILERERDTLKARIAEMEKALQASFRWLQSEVQRDVLAIDPPKQHYTGEYLNDLADMRSVRSLMENGA